MKIAIVGCRPPHASDGPDASALFSRIWRDAFAFVSALPSGTVIVSGGAQGIDAAARIAAKRVAHALIEHLPDYDRHGAKQAPLARNLLIVRDADEIHAWPAPWSRGTWHAINAARRAGKKVEIHDLAKGTGR